MKGAVLLLIFANELVLAHIILISVHSFDAFILIQEFDTVGATSESRE